MKKIDAILAIHTNIAVIRDNDAFDIDAVVRLVATP